LALTGLVTLSNRLVFWSKKMSNPYKKACVYCGELIRMAEVNPGNWVPFNISGGKHQCASQIKPTTGRTPRRQIQTSSHQRNSSQAPALPLAQIKPQIASKAPRLFWLLLLILLVILFIRQL
jgi:hypothetical protein